MAESHFSDPYVQNNATADRRQQDAQKFNQMVQMLAMANRADGQTMLGFALGKLLHDTWLNYKKKRGQAEYENGANTTLGGEGETADQQTRDALQARNAAQFFHAPTTAQGVWQQTAYHGGLSPAQYYGQQLLNGKPQAQQATQAQPTADTAQTPSLPTYQARAVEQVMGYSPKSGNYFSASVATTPTDAGTAAKPQSWDSAEKTGTNFSDMLKKYSDLQSAIGGYSTPNIPLTQRKFI